MVSEIARQDRPYSQALQKLRAAGLRPTRQRLALAKLMVEGKDGHVTAESLHADALKAGVAVSLATVYNTLHQFTEAGFLKKVVVQSGKTYFDTNVSEHHHFFFEDDGRLVDIPAGEVSVAGVPRPPEGTEIARVDVVIRVRRPGKA